MPCNAAESFSFLNERFYFNIRGKLPNPIFGNILITLYKEIELILKSEKNSFYY